jgi:AraC-like DNA-binding protein/mannose-6-phosphate isomerase-like protein (cupin superfamily)
LDDLSVYARAVPRRRTPTFQAGRRPGESAAVDLQHFDADHPRVRLGVHRHRDLELLYFVRGGGRHRVADHCWSARAGDVVLVAPVAQHDLSTVGKAQGWALEFSIEGLGGLAGGDAPLLLWHANPLLHAFLAAEADPAAGHFQVPRGERHSWSARLRQLDTELRGRRAGYREAVESHLMLILVDLARLADDIAGSFRAQRDPLLADVFALIESRYRDDITLTSIAGELGYSPAYLTHLVREKTGRTVADWITHRRMAEARKLLADTDLTAQQVAWGVGYQDPAYFSRRFRKVHGTAPSAWRASR